MSGAANLPLAIWANLGLYHLRQNELEAAKQNLEQCGRWLPTTRRSRRAGVAGPAADGNFAEAVTHLRRAVELDPNTKTRWALKGAIEQQKDPTATRSRRVFCRRF